MLKRHTILSLFFGIFATLSSFAQIKEQPSFTLSSGSMFSASGKSVEKKRPVSKKPAISLISTDLDEMLTIVNRNYAANNKPGTDKLVGSAITSMLEQLDPHSNYYSPEEFRELNEGHQGRYFGIGTTIANFDYDGSPETFILAVKPNSPAEQAGLRFGDRIIGVDGKAVFGLSSLEVRNTVRGPVGTVTKLTVERSDGSLVRDIAVKRAAVAEPSVSSTLMLDASTGYIALTDGFDYSTSYEFTAAFQSLKARGIRSLIIDLRGNGGGLMDQAILIAENFLPFGQSIMSQRGRYAVEDREWRSRNRKPETLPLVLLVDEGSASASEILAAAMQDNDRATIIGTRTFGKGLVQNVIPLEGGAGMTLTSERYYTPSGRTLQREYSDSSLYDYFRHTNKGALIARPEVAVKTRNGRTVFGGDGIQPDVVVESFKAEPRHASLLDRLFVAIRNGKDMTQDDALRVLCTPESGSAKCEADVAYLRLNASQIYSLKNPTDARFSVNAVKTDPQVDAALRALNKAK